MDMQRAGGQGDWSSPSHLPSSTMSKDFLLEALCALISAFLFLPQYPISPTYVAQLIGKRVLKEDSSLEEGIPQVLERHQDPSTARQKYILFPQHALIAIAKGIQESSPSRHLSDRTKTANEFDQMNEISPAIFCYMRRVCICRWTKQLDALSYKRCVRSGFRQFITQRRS